MYQGDLVDFDIVLVCVKAGLATCFGKNKHIPKGVKTHLKKIVILMQNSEIKTVKSAHCVPSPVLCSTVPEEPFEVPSTTGNVQPLLSTIES